MTLRHYKRNSFSQLNPYREQMLDEICMFYCLFLIVLSKDPLESFLFNYLQKFK